MIQSLLSIITTALILFGVSCSKEANEIVEDYKYLALGDSYTIGESVCETCRFPAQLVDSIEETTGLGAELKIISKTGWTTTNLLNAIEQENPNKDYDLVTLLIGVNNQYQGKNFTIYEEEFPELVSKAISFAMGDTSRLVIVSIPDYAFTPFGQSTSDPDKISNELDKYNDFAQCYADSLGIHFQNITDITREGLNNPILVASDGLHPSEEAYRRFIERLYDLSLDIIQQ